MSRSRHCWDRIHKLCSTPDCDCSCHKATKILPGYSSQEVLILVGMTYRQLDYAIRSGHVGPSINEGKGSGHPRRFSDRDVFLLRLTTALRGIGVRGDDVDRIVAHVAQQDATTLDRFHYLIINDGQPGLSDGEIIPEHLELCKVPSIIVNLKHLRTT